MFGNEPHYDLIVIGSGPGGEGAAIQAAKDGKSVAMVERHIEIGGGCTHWGTIPSKALRWSISQMAEVNSSPIFRGRGMNVQLTLPELRESARSVIEKQVSMRSSFYNRNRVDLWGGNARFIDVNRLEVTEPSGLSKVISADAFVIATGSRPYRPPGVDFNHPRIFDSDTLLNINWTPRTISIYGAGVIGCEYATMLKYVGMQINLVNTRKQLLEFLDDEIIDALAYHMRDMGIRIRHGEEYDRVEGVEDGVILHLKSGKQIKTEALLWANGRTGNADNLGLEHLGIGINARGQIEINECFQTALPHIYAVGDVIGWPSLASAAYVQGRFVAIHCATGHAEYALIREVPTGIYTSPEISSLGKTERKLTEENVPYEVGSALFRNIARGQITGQDVGMLKLLFHRESLELLGIHCFGAHAAEIIHIGQAIMSQSGSANTLLYFINTTFNYPTMAEAYRVAALNGYNRLF
ncbi:Soluble pyridine nucleotide transhydrogenase [Planctomycetes bacterium Pan216]|uniref:Soluble pyridine nucleotide transhydrogenase n=1 Tax=Kolteria novifilia TaxID=2527975 RepID=A0A518BCR9_9BACT|nr:Soluble pyridine nucleotide transhydrogenase [Planctomycetes bacterium Pan216]